MADFATWAQPTLAKLAADQQAEIVRLNNAQCDTLRVLVELAAEYARVCDMFCKVPVRSAAYLAAMDAIK
jgi:hypothetical protein